LESRYGGANYTTAMTTAPGGSYKSTKDTRTKTSTGNRYIDLQEDDGLPRIWFSIRDPEDASWNVSLVRIVVPLVMDPPK
jgi:hypothetical protein